MNEKIIDCKLDEYIAKAETALLMRDTQKAKKAAGMVVILSRLQARIAVDKLIAASEELRANERAMKEMGQSGITFPLAEHWSALLKKQRRKTKELLSVVGGQLCSALDYWQMLGATLPELCNLCNRDYAQVLREIQEGESDWRTMRFSALVHVYNLDFKSNREWLDFDIDAPLTHSIKEYYLDLMLRTSKGRKAAHMALEKCSPELVEQAKYLVTDADGNRHLIDKDGVEIATLCGDDEKGEDKP